jgi:hypothetical protein
MTDENCGRCISEAVCKLKHEADKRALDLTIDVVNARLSATDKALVLQSEETARRLEELNHLKEERRTDRQTFLDRNVFEARMMGIEKDLRDSSSAHQVFLHRAVYEVQHEELRRAVEISSKRILVLETRLVVWVSALVGFMALMELGLHWWEKISK